MHRVAVIGGAGFIASHLVELLLAADLEVLAFDNFAVGRRAHLDGAEAEGRLTIVDGDIRGGERVRAIEEFRPDTAFHLAALHFVPYCEAHPTEALEVNVLGLNNVLRAMRQAPLETFVFVSSGAIYGFGDDPWPESAPPRPNSIYGLSKWLGERLVAGLHEDRPDVRLVVARLFNTYGPRETNPHVLPDIVGAIDDGKPVELGNLWPKRDLTFVADTAAALVAMVPGAPGLETFNVGTGVGTTIEDVVAMIGELRGRAVEVRQVPERIRDDDGHLVADPTKLMEATGWAPTYDLRSGLSRLLEWEGLR